MKEAQPPQAEKQRVRKATMAARGLPQRPYHAVRTHAAQIAEQALSALRQPQQPYGLPPAFDRSVAAFFLCLTFPLMLLIALLIRLDSPGPVIFRQIRLSRDRRCKTSQRHQEDGDPGDRGERRSQESLGRPFMFYKFRTMYHNARELYPHLYTYDYSATELPTFCFKIPDDPRLTRMGRFLRKTSLDELPNLWNVVKGDIALVGPRPEIPEMGRHYEAWQWLKFKVKPGLTGYAQVNGRGFLSFQETVFYDVQYVLERSWRTDLWVLCKTLDVVVRSLGAF